MEENIHLPAPPASTKRFKISVRARNRSGRSTAGGTDLLIRPEEQAQASADLSCRQSRRSKICANIKEDEQGRRANRGPRRKSPKSPHSDLLKQKYPMFGAGRPT